MNGLAWLLLGLFVGWDAAALLFAWIYDEREKRLRRIDR